MGLYLSFAIAFNYSLLFVMKQPLSTVLLVSLERLLKALAHVYWKVPVSLGTVSCKATILV